MATSPPIRNLDDPLKAGEILGAAVNSEPSRSGNLYDAIRARLADSGGFELKLLPREPMRDPSTFD